MYMETLFEVSKAENGFILECKVPIRRKPEKSTGRGDAPVEHYPSCGEVKYVCEDMDKLFTKIKEVLPKLDVSYSSEDAFDKAFKAAAMED